LPYFATTITDFWRRWHISLSTWFRDYLYIPLGGSKKNALQTYRNLLITMLLCGLWHGAEWTFVLWGSLHGLLLCLSRMTLPFRNKINQTIAVPQKIVTITRILITFHLVSLLWIIFRANSIGEALYIIQNLGSGWPEIFIDSQALLHGTIGIVIVLVADIMQNKKPVHQQIMRFPIPVQWALCLIAVFAIILFGVDEGSQFIYFQF
jgi:alginate O-acetyltransferase complex protein AlgI